MLIDYVHPELGQDIQGRAGYSVPLEEGTIDYKGRKVLYVSGCACIDRSCCSAGSNWGYVQVPGYLVFRQTGSNGRGGPVSKVEIIEDGEDRARIKCALMSRFPGAQIEIWGTQYRQ